jgi:hypothetical protein
VPLYLGKNRSGRPPKLGAADDAPKSKSWSNRQRDEARFKGWKVLSNASPELTGKSFIHERIETRPFKIVELFGSPNRGLETEHEAPRPGRNDGDDVGLAWGRRSFSGMLTLLIPAPPLSPEPNDGLRI